MRLKGTKRGCYGSIKPVNCRALDHMLRKTFLQKLWSGEGRASTCKKREVLLHLSREKKLELLERIYNQHVRLLSPGLGWFWHHQFTSGEGADIVMESIEIVHASCAQGLEHRIEIIHGTFRRDHSVGPAVIHDNFAAMLRKVR